MLTRQKLRDFTDEELFAQHEKHLEATQGFQRAKDKSDAHLRARQSLNAAQHEIVRRFCERQKAKVTA